MRQTDNISSSESEAEIPDNTELPAPNRDTFGIGGREEAKTEVEELSRFLPEKAEVNIDCDAGCPNGDDELETDIGGLICALE